MAGSLKKSKQVLEEILYLGGGTSENAELVEVVKSMERVDEILKKKVFTDDDIKKKKEGIVNLTKQITETAKNNEKGPHSKKWRFLGREFTIGEGGLKVRFLDETDI